MRQPTCGEGLAANAALPRLFGDVLEGIAANLEAHLASLDARDPAARDERAAYEALATEHLALGRALGDLARHMASYRDMPMAPHDEAALARQRRPFEDLIGRETELRSLLDERVTREREMLAP